MLRHRPAAKICPLYSMGTNNIPMASERLRSSNGGRSAGRSTAPTSEDLGRSKAGLRGHGGVNFRSQKRILAPRKVSTTIDFAGLPIAF
jgi:hypothetical protein